MAGDVGVEIEGKVNAFGFQYLSSALKDTDKMAVVLACRGQLVQETVAYRKQNA